MGGNPGDARGNTAGSQERACISQQSLNNDISHAGDKKNKNTSQLAKKKDTKDDATLNEGDTGTGEETENA